MDPLGTGVQKGPPINAIQVFSERRTYHMSLHHMTVNEPADGDALLNKRNRRMIETEVCDKASAETLDNGRRGPLTCAMCRRARSSSCGTQRCTSPVEEDNCEEDLKLN